MRKSLAMTGSIFQAQTATANFPGTNHLASASANSVAPRPGRGTSRSRIRRNAFAFRPARQFSGKTSNLPDQRGRWPNLSRKHGIGSRIRYAVPISEVYLPHRPEIKWVGVLRGRGRHRKLGQQGTVAAVRSTDRSRVAAFPYRVAPPDRPPHGATSDGTAARELAIQGNSAGVNVESRHDEGFLEGY